MPLCVFQMGHCLQPILFLLDDVAMQDTLVQVLPPGGEQPSNGSKSLYGPFGRLCARVVLHLLGKEKMGREPQLKDETLESFGERFCRELMGHEAEATQQSQNEDSQASEVVDVRNMRAVDTALLQNQHMHLEEWYLDRIIWNCIKKACETICI